MSNDLETDDTDTDSAERQSPRARWRETHVPARLEERLDQDRVRCHLSPRQCELKPGQHGFCGVRANVGGRLVSMNYGKSVHATEETIETEAVNHFAPGERILSMGNIGCMMSCSYCHNWKTSQARYVSDADIHHYTPEGVVETALRHGIRVLSWTYNDPVVWHEFVLDTARLAKQAGLINLYKSAFYISRRAVDELLPYIDIFSISIKALDPAYYRKITKGELQPVLDATEHVFAAKKHLEVSTLMITDLTDNDETARRVTDWVLTRLDASVPTHFVRFHPDYRMIDTIRTPIPNLVRARDVARSMGLAHVYLGNVYDTTHSDTWCNQCGSRLVARHGLNAQVLGLDERGCCRRCGTDAHITLLADPPPPLTWGEPAASAEVRAFAWHGDIRSLHAQVKNPTAGPVPFHLTHTRAGGAAGPWRTIMLAPGESYRLIVAKREPDELGCQIALGEGLVSNLHEVFDRAHFPTVSIDQVGIAQSDVRPLPLFRPR